MELLGAITEVQLQFLIDNLEEEFVEDREYYIDQATIDYLKGQGADNELLQLLEKSIAELDEEEGIDIVYKR